MIASNVILAAGLLFAAAAALLFFSAGLAPSLELWAVKRAEYERWADGNLRALYSHLTWIDFARRHAAVTIMGLMTGGVLLGSWIYGILLALLCGYLPVLWMERQWAARRRAIEAQLDACLTSMANTILVSTSLPEAFATVAQHFEPPMSQEAEHVVKDVHLGKDMEEALRDFGLRCQSRNVDAVVTALSIGRKTGGELSKVLETTAGVLRETIRVEGMMDAKTSEGKAQVVVLGLTPLLFGGALQLLDPTWMRPLFTDPIGWGIIGFACVLEIIGVWLTLKISKVDV